MIIDGADGPGDIESDSDGLVVDGLSVLYRLSGGRSPVSLQAVRDVSFSVAPGRSLGIVGESGSGKSSLARALLRLAPVSSGRVIWNGIDLATLDSRAFERFRPRLQMVFQDPLAALNPRMRVDALIAEPLLARSPRLTRTERRRLVLGMMERVGLDQSMSRRFPHELSGGQAQRVGIGRAVISKPELLICDEAVSALDVSVRALILELLRELQRELNLAMLFIGHDMAVVRQMSDELLVMYLGRSCERADRDRFFSAPAHPYSQALLASVLSTDPVQERSRARAPVDGDLPSPLAPPDGCVFHTRCPMAEARCSNEIPPMRNLEQGRAVACHLARQQGVELAS